MRCQKHIIGQGVVHVKESNDIKPARVDVLLVASMIAGVALGAVFYTGHSNGASGALLAAEIAENGWLRVYLQSFAGSALFVVAAFLMGFGAVSQPFELMLVAFRGLGMGAAIRGIYSGEDIFINLALYLPFAVLSAGVLILQSCESVSMSSRYLALSVTTENRLGIANEFKDYIFKFLIYLTACAAISALYCLAVRAVWL